MSIISEALQDQQAARFISALDIDEPSHIERAFRDPARHPSFRYDQRDYGLGMFDQVALAVAENRFVRSWRAQDSLIREFIRKHTGHFTTDPTADGAKRLVERLRADGIVPMFIVQANPDAPKLFVLARHEIDIGDRIQPGNIIATLELPRP